VLGLISTIPIVFTIVVMYGFMGHTGIPLDYTTMMVGGISIGVGVDYAIHLVHGISLEVEKGGALEEAIKTVTMERGKAILANAAAVLAGFAVLLLSAMLILRNFGATMMASMFLAAVSALTVLPAALLILNPKIKKRRQK
jgi:predicted RND superfamily exporter protein